MIDCWNGSPFNDFSNDRRWAPLQISPKLLNSKILFLGETLRSHRSISFSLYPCIVGIFFLSKRRRNGRGPELFPPPTPTPTLIVVRLFSASKHVFDRDSERIIYESNRTPRIVMGMWGGTKTYISNFMTFNVNNSSIDDHLYSYQY